MKQLAWLATAALALAAPALTQAQAADAYLADDANLHAGPDASYPLIDQLEAGTEVDVQGCTEGWEWCDVIVGDERGWVIGNNLEYEDQDQAVPLPDYGAQIGIPVITFSIGTYWDRYYRERPFYRQRDYWYHRPIERRVPAPRDRERDRELDRHGDRGPVQRAGEDGRPVRIFHPPVGRPGQLGPVGPGHPVYRVPESNESRPREQERNARRPEQQPPAARSQPARNEHAAPARAGSVRHDGKDDKHDRHDH